MNNLDVDSDSDGDNWSENEDNTDPTKCLFCDAVSSTVDAAITHLNQDHKIDLKELKARFQMDCYSYIKMINYIRINKPKADEFKSINKPLWNDEKYLKPVEYEPWLCYDFESLQDGPDADIANFENGVIDGKQLEKMKALVEKLEKQIQEKNQLLEQASEDIATMRSSFKNLIEKEPTEKENRKSNLPANCVGSVSLEADGSYFSSYSHYGIHHEMLSDEVRTSTYRDALMCNAEFLRGKTVLDLGCGTSILSMFASKAGAEMVVAIDNSDIIYQAMEIARTNQFDNIKFVKGRLEDTELPIDKFDVIVSEWMGYFLIFEGMLDSIIYARERHLKPGGTLVPNRCNISLIGHGDEARYERYIGFWRNVYDFDMSCMQKEVLHEAMVEVVSPENILTEANVIADYDLMKVDVDYSNFSYDFNLPVIKDGRLTSFVGYFDTFFDLPNKKSFSTSPGAKPTHWKQVTFFLKDPVEVKANDSIQGTIICKRSIRDMRSLTVRLKVFGKEYNYTLD